MIQLQSSSLEFSHPVTWSHVSSPGLTRSVYFDKHQPFHSWVLSSPLLRKSAPIWFSELTFWLKRWLWYCCRIWFAGKEANSFSDWGTLTATPRPIKLRYKMHTSEAHAMHRSELHCLIHLYIHACTCVTTTPTVIQNMIQNCALSGSTFSHQRGHFDFFYYLWVCQLLLLLLFLKQKNNLFQKRAEVKSPWNTLRHNPGGTDLPAEHVLLLAAPLSCNSS